MRSVFIAASQSGGIGGRESKLTVHLAFGQNQLVFQAVEKHDCEPEVALFALQIMIIKTRLVCLLRRLLKACKLTKFLKLVSSTKFSY